MSETQVVTPETIAASPAVETKTRKGKYAKKDLSGPTVIFRFTNGETREIDPTSFPPEVQFAYTKHGISAKHGDAYAPAKSVEEAIGLFDNSVRIVREKGFEGRAPGEAKVEESVEMLAQAMLLAKTSPAPLGDGLPDNRTVAEVAEKVKTFDRKQRQAYRNHPLVAYHLAQLKSVAAQAETALAAF